jgi:hypothetical protein
MSVSLVFKSFRDALRPLNGRELVLLAELEANLKSRLQILEEKIDILEEQKRAAEAESQRLYDLSERLEEYLLAEEETPIQDLGAVRVMD